MAFRFRKRLRVAPGIYLNLGRNGVSTTIGPRGANINVSKKDTYLNTSIPGTGISNRQKLFESKQGSTDKLIDADRDVTTLSDKPEDVPHQTVTSKGLVGLKEQLELARKERKEIQTEINQTQIAIQEALTALTNKQVSFFSKLFTSKEKLAQLQQELNDLTVYAEDLKKQYVKSSADVNVQFDKELEEQYKKVSVAFQLMAGSRKIWDITGSRANTETKSAAKSSVSRAVVTFKFENIDFIESENPAFHFQNANGSQIYIYPAFVLLIDSSDNLSLIDLKDLKFTFLQQPFIESESVPDDTKITQQVWAKVNKDGSPDLRFKGNYQTPQVIYTSMSLESPNGLNESYMVSNYIRAEIFAKEFSAYLSILKGESQPSVQPPTTTVTLQFTKQSFDAIQIDGLEFLSFIEKLKGNKNFIDRIYESPNVKQQPFKTSDELLDYFFIFDLMKSFSLVADIGNLNTKESLALRYIISSRTTSIVKSLSDVPLLFDSALTKSYEKIYLSLKPELAKPADETVFKISLLLSVYDKDLQRFYLNHLYRFASLVVKADEKITPAEEFALKSILKLSEQSVEKKDSDLKLKVTPPKEQNLQQVLQELEELVGLSAVKEEVRSLINFIKVQKAREQTGLKSSPISYHIVFTGNPGTGKTTVARLISEIYKQLSVLKQGQLVETDRSGLVAEYLGQTGVKVNKAVDSAINGVLFVDEAYALVGENRDDFGKEAVSTLIKRMEDDRDKLVVILAGYSNEMEKFIDTNPGLKSRFNRYIDFPDYSPLEMLGIFQGFCKKMDYRLSDNAGKKLLELFNAAYSKRDKSFGNGRFVRNIFEKTSERQANRLVNVTSLTKEILAEISDDDIP